MLVLVLGADADSVLDTDTDADSELVHAPELKPALEFAVWFSVTSTVDAAGLDAVMVGSDMVVLACKASDAAGVAAAPCPRSGTVVAPVAGVDSVGVMVTVGVRPCDPST